MNMTNGDEAEQQATPYPDTTTNEASSSSSGLFPKSHFKSAEDQNLIRNALHSSPFFTCLDAEQIDRLIRLAHKETFVSGEVVIIEGCVDEDGQEEDEYEQGHNTEAKEGRYLNYENPKGKQPSTDAPQMPTTMEAMADADDVEMMVDADVDAGEGAAKEGIGEVADAILDDDEDSSSETNEISTEALSADTIADDDEDSYGAITIESTTPPSPRSGKLRSLYIIRNGQAKVLCTTTDYNGKRPSTRQVHSATLQKGTLFGEGGFLFGRQHSASVVVGGSSLAGEEQEQLECFVIDLPTFRGYVLPSENMKHLFDRYAKQRDANNASYMDMADFYQAWEYAANQTGGARLLWPDPTCLYRWQLTDAYPFPSLGSHSQPQALPFAVSSGAPRIYLDQFCWFHLLLARPDPEVDLAFLLLDRRQCGMVYLDDALAWARSQGSQELSGDTDFFRRYFGPRGDQGLRAPQFAQFWADFPREVGQQAFLSALQRSMSTGPTSSLPPQLLPPKEFIRILLASIGWVLPQGIVDRLETIYVSRPYVPIKAPDSPSPVDGRDELVDIQKAPHPRYFSYADFLAFQEVLSNLPGICNLIAQAQELKRGEVVSVDDLKVVNRALGRSLNRRQVDVLFELFDLDRDGYISRHDVTHVCGIDLVRPLVPLKGRHGRLTFAPSPDYQREDEEAAASEQAKADSALGRWIKHWSITAVAGALGVVALYPLDLIKTRLMNQRLGSDGTRMYANSLDCFRKVFSKEGAVGLFRGLSPQLLGVVPEKAIKLRVNDLLRQVFSSRDEETGGTKLSLPMEVFAGACAGACQILVTNPKDVACIRMQLQGETSLMLKSKGVKPPALRTMIAVIRDLGFPGVYRGASACLLRDVPFGAIYFPCYAACKEELSQRNEIPGYSTAQDLLLAGTLAAIPSAVLTSPMDVIKTRLQSVPRPGEAAYKGIRDCATKIFKHEGWKGFFQGVGPRVLRIAPQFGISLLAYEELSRRVFGGSNDITPMPPTNAFVHPHDYRTAFPHTGALPHSSSPTKRTGIPVENAPASPGGPPNTD